MATFKKIIFWVFAVLSMVLVVLALLHSAKPEWFAGIIETFGWDPATVNALLTTFGFGGAVGTAGFSVIISTLTKSLAAGTKLSDSTIKMVEDTTLAIVKESKENYQILTAQVKGQEEASKVLAENQAKATATLEALLLTLSTLIDLETINLNKTLNNPLVDEKTKDAIKKGLELLNLNTAEPPDEPEAE